MNWSCIYCTMAFIRVQSVLLRSLIVFGVFGISISAYIEFDRSQNDESPEHSVFYAAAKLTQSLANRNHTIIASVSDVLMTEDQLKEKIDDLYSDRVKHVERVRDEYQRSMKERIQSANEYIANNEATIDAVFDRTLGSDENSDDQLNAQIIRHRLNTPMKVIQLLLSLAMTDIAQSVESNTNANLKNKSQLFQHIIEQLKFKPRVMKEVRDDLNSLLEENSTVFLVKPTLDALGRLTDEILTGDRVPAVNVTKSLSIEWNYLTTIVIITLDPPHFANQLQNLTRCPELGIVAYRECRGNPTKLAAFSAQVDKFRASA